MAQKVWPDLPPSLYLASVRPQQKLLGAFFDNQLAEVILPQELYNNRHNSEFDQKPAGLKFYEYDSSETDKKGRKLN